MVQMSGTLMSASGHLRTNRRGPKSTFDCFSPKADKRERNWIVRFVPILLQKSFCTADQKFSGL
jgi:hypothetical protein